MDSPTVVQTTETPLRRRMLSALSVNAQQFTPRAAATMMAAAAGTTTEATKEETLPLDNHLWLLAIFTAIFIFDVYVLGIGGEANTRALIVVDSFAHCASWISSADDLVVLRVFFSVVTKYSAGTFLSLVLHVTPSIINGWWANLTFLATLVLAHLFPSISRLARSRTGIWRVYFVVSGSVFKSRKFRFAMSNAASLGGPYFVLIIGVLSIELTAWLAWGARRVLRNASFFAPPDVVLATLLSPRMLLTLLAIYATYNDFHPLVTVLVLLVHKATKPSSENVVY